MLQQLNIVTKIQIRISDIEWVKTQEQNHLYNNEAVQ